MFTPAHRSWLNLVETLFSKMARSVLRHMRVNGKHELCSRIDCYFEDLNADPQILRWKHGIEDVLFVTGIVLILVPVVYTILEDVKAGWRRWVDGPRGELAAEGPAE